MSGQPLCTCGRHAGRPLREHRTTMALYLACLADQLAGGGEE
ncbi:hypothetical protein [Streptomyces cylindrosporus]|nr:hypothetical protein [Streptomyces cylindrosporus]